MCFYFFALLDFIVKICYFEYGMQEKEAYKTRYENPMVLGNDLGSNQSADGIAEKGNLSSNGFCAPTEYNDPASVGGKAKLISMDALKKTLQLVIAIFGSSMVGLGLLFSTAASTAFKAKVNVVSLYPDEVYCMVSFDESNDTTEGSFEIKCETRHTTAYSQSYYFEGTVDLQEYSFSGLSPNTEYVVKLYRNGTLLDKKIIKTLKNN